MIQAMGMPFETLPRHETCPAAVLPPRGQNPGISVEQV